MQKNDLHYIADDSFVGLSKFLSELDLAQNRLTVIPNAALRRLAKQSKLRFLNLGRKNLLFLLLVFASPLTNTYLQI